MYAAFGALNAEQKREYTSLLPPCYSQQFDRCWNNPASSDFPGCERINALYETDDDGVTYPKGDSWAEQQVDVMPYCPVPGDGALASGSVSLGTIVIYASVAGVIGLGLGYLLGS